MINIPAAKLGGIDLTTAGNKQDGHFVLIGQLNDGVHAVQAHGANAKQRTTTFLQKIRQFLMEHDFSALLRTVNST